MEENRKEFPNDLIEQILLRLSVRTLLRFKCVSKTWYSLISDPQFAESHFDIAAAPTHRLILKSANHSQVNSVDIEAPLHINSANLIFNIPLPSPALKYPCNVDIAGFCRGFILLTNRYWVNNRNIFDFIIWNPSTGLQKRISMSDRGHFWGFVYDSSADDYVVVTLTLRVSQCRTEFSCLSLRTNSWSCIGTVNYHPLVNRQGLLFNGALHWMVGSYDDQSIVVFDVKQRRLSYIPLPADPVIGLNFNVCYLVVMGGCLSLCLVEEGYRTTMWTMKEYKMESSWIKSFVLSSSSDPLLPVFYPICSTENGDILGSNGKALVRLNDNGELLEHKGGQKIDELGLLHCGVYRETLLSLPGEFQRDSIIYPML